MTYMLIIIIRATQKWTMSKPVTSTEVRIKMYPNIHFCPANLWLRTPTNRKKTRYPAHRSRGQFNRLADNVYRQRPELLRHSSQKISPSGPYHQIGIWCPHPQLTGNTPRLDIAHPFKIQAVHRGLGHKLHFAVFDRTDGFFWPKSAHRQTTDRSTTVQSQRWNDLPYGITIG